MNTNGYYCVWSTQFSCTPSLKHRHTYSTMPEGRPGSEARLFQVGSVFLRLGSEMREGEDKQTVCLLSDYSMQCVFISVPPVGYSLMFSVQSQKSLLM